MELFVYKDNRVNRNNRVNRGSRQKNRGGGLKKVGYFSKIAMGFFSNSAKPRYIR